MRGPLIFRRARAEDLVAVVSLLADDPIGVGRERLADPLPDAYLRAFRAIEADPRSELIVADLDGEVVGTCQVSYLPNLTLMGTERAQLEGVRVRDDQRGRGVGRLLIEWVADEARLRGCGLLQLTTDRRRPEAVGFYESLGFTASHVGFKRPL